MENKGSGTQEAEPKVVKMEIPLRVNRQEQEDMEHLTLMDVL